MELRLSDYSFNGGGGNPMIPAFCRPKRTQIDLIQASQRIPNPVLSPIIEAIIPIHQKPSTLRHTLKVLPGELLQRNASDILFHRAASTFMRLRCTYQQIPRPFDKETYC